MRSHRGRARCSTAQPMAQGFLQRYPRFATAAAPPMAQQGPGAVTQEAASEYLPLINQVAATCNNF